MSKRAKHPTRSSDSVPAKAPSRLKNILARVPSFSRAERLFAVLAAYEGMTDREIAVTLDVSLGEIDRIKHAAMAKAGVDSLSGLRTLLEHGARWDVFISHASTDKRTLVRPLAHELERFGLRVWYDEFVLKVGQSLSESIDRGLADAAFGLVVLSPAFFDRPWTKRELRAIEQKNLANPGILLPIWHNISRDEVARQSYALADLVAVVTDGLSIRDIARRVLEQVSPVLVRQQATGFFGSKPTQNVRTIKTVSIAIGHEEVELSRSQAIHVALCYEVFKQVCGISHEQWFRDFRVEGRVDDEIAVWSALAAAFVRAGGTQAPYERAKRYYDILLGLSMLPVEELRKYPASDVQTLARYLAEAWAPAGQMANGKLDVLSLRSNGLLPPTIGVVHRG